MRQWYEELFDNYAKSYDEVLTTDDFEILVIAKK